MHAVVTCGPSYEPVDQVRRLTNASTGELGALLSEALAAEGWNVLCLKGEGATWPGPHGDVRTARFTTNDDLWALLQDVAAQQPVHALFHTAALCDYRVARLEDAEGRVRSEGKVPSRLGELVLRLAPARKVISGLRTLFPGAWLVGWKYEVDGTREQALERGWQQMVSCATDACVVNGPACGSEFLVCARGGTTAACSGKAHLVRHLAQAAHRLASPA